MKRIHILAIDTGNEAQAIRSAAECWGVQVGVTWVGNSQQIVADLSAPPSCDLLIIAGHGDGGALLLPELDVSIAAQYPYQERIMADEFRAFLALDDQVVVNLSCDGGHPDLVRVFLEKGARAYIASAGYPDGDAALMYVLSLIYQCTVSNQALRCAHEQAIANAADDRGVFQLFSAS